MRAFLAFRISAFSSSPWEKRERIQQGRMKAEGTQRAAGGSSKQKEGRWWIDHSTSAALLLLTSCRGLKTAPTCASPLPSLPPLSSSLSPFYLGPPAQFVVVHAHMQIFQLPVLGSRQLRHRASDGPGPGPASGDETPQEPPKRGQQRLLLSEPGPPGRGGFRANTASASAAAGAGAGPRPGGSHRRHLGGGGKMEEEEEGRRRQKALLESRILLRVWRLVWEKNRKFSPCVVGEGVEFREKLCVLQKTKALNLHIAVFRKRMLYQTWLKSLSWVCGNSSQAHGKLLETHFHASAWLGFPGKGHLEAASWNSLRGRTVGLSSKLKVQPLRRRLHGLRSRRFQASHLRPPLEGGAVASPLQEPFCMESVPQRGSGIEQRAERRRTACIAGQSV